MTAYHEEDVFAGSSSRFASSGRKAASRKTPSVNGRRSPPSATRGASLAESFDDDAANGRHSLAHELAYALMPESGGSMLLAEELGIEYDEGAQGIDESVPTTDDVAPPELGDTLPDTFGSATQKNEENEYDTQSPSGFDPAFDTPSKPQRHTRLPEQDPMVVLAEDLESTEKFLSQLRRLDAEQSGQLNLERLASAMIRRIDDTVREREGQVRALLEYEREFRRIAGEIGGNDVLGHLDELEDIIEEEVRPTPAPSQELRHKPLDAISEEPESHNTTNGADWEADLERDRSRLGDEEDEFETALQSPTPLKTSFIVPPTVDGPPTPKATVTQLAHLRTFTTTVASSLATISEQTQVNSAATTEAGRKIRALKNKLGGWRTEWDSAERSRVKIEKWEAGVVDIGEVPGTPTRSSRSRADGRRIVKEHLEAFGHALTDANARTQAIIAAVS